MQDQELQDALLLGDAGVPSSLKEKLWAEVRAKDALLKAGLKDIMQLTSRLAQLEGQELDNIKAEIAAKDAAIKGRAEEVKSLTAKITNLEFKQRKTPF